MRTLLLSILFTVGFALPSTLLVSCCGECDPGPPFFDITGISLNGHTYFSPDSTTSTAESFDVIEFSSYKSTYFIFTADYVASTNESNFNWDLSITPSAYALDCDCDYTPGISGAKTESIATLTVTVLDDFNTTYQADDDVTALFDLDPIVGQQTLLSSLYSEMILNTKPDQGNPIRFRVDVILSSGEHYTTTTPPVGFI